MALVEGSWLAPLPRRLRGRVDLVVSNPPYVTEEEWAGLAPEVRAEPRQALVAGPGRQGAAGLADVEAVLEEARRWLGRPGAVVVELAPAAGRCRGGSGPATGVRRGAGRARPGGTAPRARGRGAAAQNRGMDLAPGPDDDPSPAGRRRSSAAVLDALVAGAIIAVPNVGGYSLAVRAGSSDDEARLVELAADPDGPHYAVGQIDDVRALTSGWTDELRTLLQRCWPGPVEVFLPSAGSAGGPAAAGGDERRPLRPTGSTPPRTTARPSTAPGPSSSACPTGGRCGACAASRARGGRCPLRFTEAGGGRPGLPRRDVAVVVDGGRREGPSPTVVDATVTPIRVLREGALPGVLH